MGLRKSLEFYKSLPSGLNHDQEALMGYFYSFIEETNFLFTAVRREALTRDRCCSDAAKDHFALSLASSRGAHPIQLLL